MIYLDTSVVLAQLLAEDRSLPVAASEDLLVSSRLLKYEVWNRIHARGLTQSHSNETRASLDRVVLMELTRPILARALEPFPIPVRTLDALHLATVEFLRRSDQDVQLASFDPRLNAGARALGISLYEF